ncbi:hypothetical protein IFM89_015183 [Coptis chinensis]|uniref:F-box domain-containing protein n=1 Tax=Coptis chinensis TaxID=261450 RepID=A0A835LIN7_9MAGN|nr:hypothetical protein IFM89_015183 [Coptis chinensis]
MGTPCSRLESLPMELVIKILCHLNHDQLQAVFHVSTKIREALLVAKNFYFDFKTPPPIQLTEQNLPPRNNGPFKRPHHGYDFDHEPKLTLTDRSPRKRPNHGYNFDCARILFL